MSAVRAADHTRAFNALVGKPPNRHVYEALDRYVDMLVGVGVDRGLLGPREPGRIWERHILNCAALAPLLPSRASVADVGSGAGLPGVVLAVLRPDLTVTLIEPLLRRADFLTEVLTALELTPRLTVVRARAEEYRAGPVDVVVARAVAPLDRLAAWCLPLVRAGGTLLAMKGARAQVELDQHRVALGRLGARSAAVQVLGDGVLTEPSTVVAIRKR